MSEEQKNISEEVDLGKLFNAIASLFTGLFNIIGRIFNFFFSNTLFSLKIIIRNYKVVIPVLILSSILGYVIEKDSEPFFQSKMLVRTFFDSKFQLVDNLKYYNSLIRNESYEELSQIFEINPNEIAKLKSFKIDPGLETRNDHLKYYDAYIKEIDTSMSEIITFDEFIENRDLLSGDLFEITAISAKKDIFKKLEIGLKESFANKYSTKIKQMRDSSWVVRKKTIINQINNINELKKAYLSYLEMESKSPKLKMSFGEIPVTQEKAKTYEFELLNQEIQLQEKLRDLEEEKIRYDQFYEILSSFQETGTIYKPITKNYVVFFPIFSFFVLIIIYLSYRAIIYILKYE